MENNSILKGMSFSHKWHEITEESISEVMTIYSLIEDRFSKDPKYGVDFVKNNYNLIGQLTIAAVKNIDNKIKL